VVSGNNRLFFKASHCRRTKTVDKSAQELDLSPLTLRLLFEIFFSIVVGTNPTPNT
jgi:hypothetical protein